MAKEQQAPKGKEVATEKPVAAAPKPTKVKVDKKPRRKPTTPKKFHKGTTQNGVRIKIVRLRAGLKVVIPEPNPKAA